MAQGLQDCTPVRESQPDRRRGSMKRRFSKLRTIENFRAVWLGIGSIGAFRDDFFSTVVRSGLWLNTPSMT